MPKYLMQVSYTADGAKGLVKDGGSKRREVAGKLIQSLGGKMEAFYFAFGDYDAAVIFDAPSEMDAVRLIAPRRAVIRAGKIVARTEPARHTVVWNGTAELVDFLRR